MTNITPDRHCGIVTPKVDYIKNYGYCDSCRLYVDEQHKRDLEQYQDDMKYLRDNGLI